MPSITRTRTSSTVPAILCLAVACTAGPRISAPPSSTAPAATVSSGTPARDDLGVLVMAHGGGAEWNEHVSASMSELARRVPLAVAFGMADPHTLQAALGELEGRGASTIAVVRLFLSGESFLHQTEFLFGRRSDPPAMAMMGSRMVAGSELPLLETESRILLDTAGLAGSEQVNGIVHARADASSPDPAATGVLLLAHGMGAEDENRRLLDAMEQSAGELRLAGYGEVVAAALREDWAQARARAERDIRAIVSRMGKRWEHILVIPYRVYGFGPYAEVLDGLDYVGAQGLLPHDSVADWVAARSSAVFCAAGFTPALAACPAEFEPASR